MSVILGAFITLALPFLAFWLGGWWGLGMWGAVCFSAGCLGAAIAWDHEPVAAFVLAFGAWPWLVVEWLLGN